MIANLAPRIRKQSLGSSMLIRTRPCDDSRTSAEPTSTNVHAVEVATVSRLVIGETSLTCKQQSRYGDSSNWCRGFYLDYGGSARC